MSLFTISDLHLSTHEQTNKSMEIFGKRWESYVQRLEKNWRAVVTEKDTVVIPGDISWAIDLNEALSDLKFIDALPGKKILGKGNHDFWWATMSKHRAFFEKHGIRSISFLFNNFHETEEYLITGTRGWYLEADAMKNVTPVDFDKIIAREVGRLKMSLDAAKARQTEVPEKEILTFLHFPPYWNEKCTPGIYDLLKEYSVKDIYFGHIHNTYNLPPITTVDGMRFHLISADYLDFLPKII
ncbi:MAG: metallophosphoesterase [Clostridia bacterium]|nr:metallophosphoesterase [Clostridia bacterium]